MGKRLFHTQYEFIKETFDEFEKRYSGFGKDIYIRIREQFPQVFEKLEFYQGVTFQPEDSFAQYNDEHHQFVIQLDPLCEVICLWNNYTQVEIGTWSKDEYAEAISLIQTEFLKKQ